MAVAMDPPPPHTPAQIVRIIDGDTLTVTPSTNPSAPPETLRLACIDAPELAQTPYGSAARDRLQTLAPPGTAVTIRPLDHDRYGRTVAEVFQGDTNLNLTLVQEGQAVVYDAYIAPCDSGAYYGAQQTAQGDRRVFWQPDQPTLPWDFRHNPRTPAPSTAVPAPLMADSSSNPLPPCVQTDCNCTLTDLANQREAKRVLNAFPGDPHRLDGDKDGKPCESLPP
ncbi:hypothetical protein PROH_02505 [Prochlorothrix hollandica PCC 9006 = CALU 1027]|uniref:TNase-like domain-containing protein n=2 Tax=Prochlorothrix hollandica TaxID=1223 RepID=A0A0M2PYZ2_PROHO|nr:hypothetical protein PROH_02505 [Prochlorothrix hollandica PCC 9006 = CALU 1027]